MPHKGSTGFLARDAGVDQKLAPHLVEFLAPIQERREYYVEHREAIDEILAEGNKKAQVIARQNLKEAREAMGI